MFYATVRQSIVDGANQVQQQAALIVGEVLGDDAVEISVHGHSAPDHEPVQGHIFYNEQYQLMQSGQDCFDIQGRHYAGFKRPIMEWNCRHFAMPCRSAFHKQFYTDEQLQKFIDDNNVECWIDGKHYSIYEASQTMRQLETEIRRQKEVAVFAQMCKNDDVQMECQAKINAYNSKLLQIAGAAKLPYRGDLTTVEGFKPIKINSIESKRALFDIKFNKKYRAKDESELLFNRSKAEGIIKKITAYSLNKEHPTGKNKAVVFEKALGYNSNNADVLEKEIFKELGVYKAIPKGNDGHGEKYDVVMLITGANPKVQPVVTGWIFDNGVDFPRMVTTYVHKVQRP